MGEFYIDTLFGGATDLEEGAFVTIEVSSDDTDLATEHGGGDFAREIVDGVVGPHHCIDETTHFPVGHFHGITVLAALDVAELKGVGSFYYGQKRLPGGVNKEQVSEEGHLLTDALAFLDGQLPFQGGEDLKTHFAKHDVCWLLGIGSLEVAEHQPKVGF